MIKKQTVKFTTTCQHGKKTTLELKMPFTITVFEDDFEGDERFSLWLSSNDRKWHLTPLVTLFCSKEADFTADAFTTYVTTPMGEKAALSLVRRSDILLGLPTRNTPNRRAFETCAHCRQMNLGSIGDRKARSRNKGARKKLLDRPSWLP